VHVTVALGAVQQMKLDEAGHAIEMAVTRKPDGFERLRGVFEGLDGAALGRSGCIAGVAGARLVGSIGRERSQAQGRE
jgi:hypothetical protein